MFFVLTNLLKPVMKKTATTSTFDSAADKRIQNWFFTLNNYTKEDIKYLLYLFEKGEFKYIIFQEEKGEEGTPHLQGTVVLSGVKTMKNMKLLLGSDRYHLEPTKDIQAAIDYCQKEETRIENTPVRERGRRPLAPKQRAKKGGDAERERWAEVHTLLRNGNLDSIAEAHPQIFIQHFRSLVGIESRYLNTRQLEPTMLANVWYFGESGTGKTRSAREQYPNAYIKDCTKWWDNYAGQDVVIIDELQPEHATMAPLFKKWADHYPCSVEMKGGAMMIRPKRIIITSNFRPEQIFLREEDLQPILRRFTVYEFRKNHTPRIVEEAAPAVLPGVSQYFVPPPRDVGSPVPFRAPVLEEEEEEVVEVSPKAKRIAAALERSETEETIRCGTPLPKKRKATLPSPPVLKRHPIPPQQVVFELSESSSSDSEEE